MNNYFAKDYLFIGVNGDVYILKKILYNVIKIP